MLLCYNSRGVKVWNLTSGERMDKIYEQTLLFDFYGELLTEKQREICRMHLQEDLSLGEISDELGISRQGVSDAVHRSLKALEGMEQKLHMCERFLKISEYIEQMQQGLQAEASKEELESLLLNMKDSIKIRS